MAERTLASAERLRLDAEARGVANRAYYAVYQAATALCYEHGDESQFPHGWNNPSHDQLPDLIRKNGNLSLWTRRRISQLLNTMRSVREDADYRPGRTVNIEIALEQLQNAATVLRLLEGT